jgi:hypothetical protein
VGRGQIFGTAKEGDEVTTERRRTSGAEAPSSSGDHGTAEAVPLSKTDFSYIF